MESIQVPVQVNQEVVATVDISDVIEAINELPMARRWNYVASLLNHALAEQHTLTDSQKELIKKWLQGKLDSLQSCQSEPVEDDKSSIINPKS